MTLFFTSPSRRRVYEVNDFYAMALTMIIFFAVGRIIKAAIKNQEAKNQEQVTTLPNPRGGGVLEVLSGDEKFDPELMTIMLSCINENESYLVENQAIKELIFRLVKANIQTESLVLTPNLLRFLALWLKSMNINEVQKTGWGAIIPVLNVGVYVDNTIRFSTRLIGTAIIGLLTGAFSTIVVATIMAYAYYDLTDGCGYRCEDYFTHLPKTEALEVVVEQSTGNLIIAGNDASHQIDMYMPLKEQAQSIELKPIKTSEKEVTKRYIKSRKKAKLVKFSEFRKTDPVLSKFNDLKEPTVKQKKCFLKELEDLDALE